MRPTHVDKNRFLIIFTSLIALVLNAASNSQYWQIRDGKIQPLDTLQVSGKPTLAQPRLSGDLDSDGRLECLSLTEGTVQVTDCEADLLWQSPQDWRVTEAQIGDLNRDGLDEVILLVWRPFQPWPVDQFMPFGGMINDFHDKNGYSCQIILIGWARNAYRELWAGSPLVRPLSDTNVADLDGDGWQELAALESHYDSTTPDSAITVWSWLGFGFTLTDRLEGSFHELAIVTDFSNNWLITH